MQAIVNRGDLIRKINFPKYIIVISGTISALINLLLNLIVVFIFIIINGVDVKWSVILFPLTIIELYIFALAIAFALAALYVKFRDIGHIWEVVIQGLFYGTPIIYPLTTVMQYNTFAAEALLLSPVAQSIQDARYTAISHSTQTTWSLVHEPMLRAIPIIIVVVTVLFAIYYFRKNQKYFAEDV